jgi:hypothetical protein
MPLTTKITRDGEVRTMPNGWGGFHVAAMVLTAMAEDPRQESHEKVRDMLRTWHRTNGDEAPMPISPGDAHACMDYGIMATTALNDGPYTVKERHVFVDIQDDEIFELLPGDQLHAWRSWK